MLVQAHMGGMEEMGRFCTYLRPQLLKSSLADGPSSLTRGPVTDDHCLETLYPPGLCGAFCNQHTYDCFVEEVHLACCDELGGNCVRPSSMILRSVSDRSVC